MKKILILGGGFLQTFVIKKAKELNYYVYVLDADPKAVGYQYADEHEIINIIDEKACLKYAREKKIDGVLTAATDFGVLTMSRIALEMGLPGINYASAKTIKNKASVRKCLFDAKACNTGYSYEITSCKMISKILPKINFPVMVKPCDGSGSRGTSRVDIAKDFLKACELAMNGSITHSVLIEPFVIGKEYGVESFVDNGNIHVLAVMQKDMTLPPYFAELGHAIPSGLPLSVEESIISCVTKALLALGVNHGSVNMDLILSEEQEVHIVDVGARMGGNLIGSHIIPIGTGIDYMGNMIKAAVGDKTNWDTIQPAQSVATQLLALRPGRVNGLPSFAELEKLNNVRIEHHLHIGDTITPYRTNLDGCGYVIATRNLVSDAIEIASRVRNTIDESIVRK